MGIDLDFSPVIEASPFIVKGVGMTLYVTIVAMAVGLFLGLIVAVLRMVQFKPVQVLAMAYIDFFRGLPQLAFLIWLYFGVTLAFSLNLSPLTAAISCLAIQEAAYLAEVYRSGLQAIPN